MNQDQQNKSDNLFRAVLLFALWTTAICVLAFSGAWAAETWGEGHPGKMATVGFGVPLAELWFGVLVWWVVRLAKGCDHE